VKSRFFHDIFWFLGLKSRNLKKYPNIQLVITKVNKKVKNSYQLLINFVEVPILDDVPMSLIIWFLQQILFKNNINKNINKNKI